MPAGHSNPFPPFRTLPGAMMLAAANPIHNGGFSVWQRGSSFTSMADQTYMADRWLFGKSGSIAVLDCSQGAVPSRAALVPGSNYSLALTVTTADASIAAGDLVYIEHRIEGYDWFPFAEKQFTVGFWVYSTVNATYCVAARNSGGTQSCNIEYTINASNTWEYKTVTFPASPMTGFSLTNGIGLRLTWALAAGSTYTATAGSWSASNTLASNNQVDAVGTNGNVFLLWGVTMALGATVAPFWPRSFGEELDLCRRYYESLPTGQYVALAAGSVSAATTADFSLYYQEKRATPTITGAAANLVIIHGASTVTALSIALNGLYPGTDRTFVRATVAAGLTTGQAALLCSNSSTPVTISADL